MKKQDDYHTRVMTKYRFHAPPNPVYYAQQTGKRERKMRYLILVSHGTFAPGLHNALGMMAGSDREDIRSTSLLDGMDVDTFRVNFAELVKDITAEDEIILTADIIGGSPLTTALDVLTEKGLLGKTLAIGGMNLPLVLTAAFADADTPLEKLEQELTGEAKDQIKRFDLGGDEDDDI